MRIGCAHNFAEQNERGIGETVFFQDRIERNVFAVMTELTLRHIEYDTVVDLVPLCVVWQKNKLRGSGTQSSPLFFTARIKSSHVSQPNASVTVSAVSLWKPAQRCRS